MGKSFVGKRQHGGDLLTAARDFGRPSEQWLDLSTGISPWAYPVPDLPDYLWQRLPYAIAPLLEAAAAYYQCPEHCVTPVAGSQDALWRIPALLSVGCVAIPSIGYSEHEFAWRSAGHEVFHYDTPMDLLALIENKMVDHVIIINPNNPSTALIDRDWLLMLREQMSDLGLLLVDEAFMDVESTHSLSQLLPLPGVLVLRSVGKFFGLAGLRLGFILGLIPQVTHLRDHLGPWPINYPAIVIAEKAFNDKVWQHQQRQRIANQSELLKRSLEEHLNVRVSSLGLFLTVIHNKESLWEIYQSAAQRGILLRYQRLDDNNAWLRFGLPGDSWCRFEQWLLGKMATDG